LRGIQASATRGALDRRTDVVGRPDPDTWPILREGARLVGLVEAARDDDRVVRRLERLGQATRRRERGRSRQANADGREFAQGGGSSIHVSERPQRPADARVAGPETDGWPRSANRHGSSAHGSPAYATPIRA